MLTEMGRQSGLRKCSFALLFFALLLFCAGCSAARPAEFTPVTLVPTPLATELPEGIERVHDATVSYLMQEYDLRLPARAADWSIEYNVAGDLVGAGAYRLAVEGCVMSISNPLMAPHSLTYYVVMDDVASGLHWEGYVDCQGGIVPAASSRPSASDTLSSTVPDTINIVQLANLRKTVGIEVCWLDCASYVPRYTIGNRQLIAALVEALDTDMKLRPHAPCPASYQLRFILEDGQHYDFGYACQMMTPSFLRGSQEFWRGQDGIAPDAFNALLLPLIQLELPDAGV